MTLDVKMLVKAWLEQPDKAFPPEDPSSFDSAFDIVFDLVRESPEVGWAFIQEACTLELSPKRASGLAAGPLEDLLCHHGNALIGRVETLAAQSPVFRGLLAGVWQSSMSPAIWSRIQVAAQNNVPQSAP